ncbi:uncharacterized protein LOC116594149 isoform X3 [Mustela erminea]|uniref:uncharacterized protein LOC116594149 isoform X3 n=1 Tax=Mustela erminea TaxID=36723 RepID=UPI00138750FF|nr:uncharacterized protein LOC116594149 isoform X3 [Mustela erminea]
MICWHYVMCSKDWSSVPGNMWVCPLQMMDITKEAVSFKAYLTLWLLFNCWSIKTSNKVTEQAMVIIGHLFFLMPSSKLKNQVNRLTRWFMTLVSAKVTPFYISQLSETVKESDPHSARNHIIALKAFYILSKLYNDQVVFLIQKTMKTSDPAKIVSALQVFMDVFPEVPQTEQLKNEVMHSIIIMIQDDLKPVSRKAGHLSWEGSCFLETLKLYKMERGGCSWMRENEEDIQQMCSEILQMVSLPKLITLACQPSNTLAFVLLSKIATNMALKARSLGQVPYLSSFHLSPTQFISPQKLLTHLVVFALKSYSERELGISSLRLLHALHPITSLHPVINSNVGQLWMKEIPQMLQILDGLFVWTMFCTEQICSPEFCASRFPRTLFLVLRGSAKSVGFGTRDPDHTEKNLDQEEWEDRLLQFSSQSLVAINDDSWLEQLIKVV